MMSGQTSQLYIILVQRKPEKYNTEVFTVYIIAETIQEFSGSAIDYIILLWHNYRYYH